MFDINNFKELLEYRKENENITIAVAMSGGVDSSVTARSEERRVGKECRL